MLAVRMKDFPSPKPCRKPGNSTRTYLLQPGPIASAICWHMAKAVWAIFALLSTNRWANAWGKSPMDGLINLASLKIPEKKEKVTSRIDSLRNIIRFLKYPVVLWALRFWSSSSCLRFRWATLPLFAKRCQHVATNRLVLLLVVRLPHFDWKNICKLVNVNCFIP